ncbi:Hypothetical predicted protein [Mytilus galloprovincialis]|uniref:Uncharacterized protein n=1 Tax=Mytilus galloprovincialis TaxID=29158 RepID=A0A8B6DDZ1_MYTGA|nr:Hypothetical predicted protein [Mytilus galloprovincialis]
MSDDGSETHQQQPVLSGDIFTILHLLEHQAADWVVSARNGRYKLIVKWTSGKMAERERSTLPPKKKSSKSRSERNNRRLRAFLAKKSESTAEIGTPAQMLENDSSKSDELGNTAQPIETDSAMDTPAEPISKKDEAPPLPTATSSPKGPASSINAEGTSTTGRVRKERRKHKKGEIIIEKITLDLPQKTYLLEVEGKTTILIANCDTLKEQGLIEKEDNEAFYKDVKRSHDHWLDIRDKRNFLYSEQRVKDIEKLAELNNLYLKIFK